MNFTDRFPGLDKILPKDIIFSALDNIDPSWEPNVSKFYGKLPADRERWAIPWWESDGGVTRHDQFMPGSVAPRKIERKHPPRRCLSPFSGGPSQVPLTHSTFLCAKVPPGRRDLLCRKSFS
jgi:hypothetical protein